MRVHRRTAVCLALDLLLILVLVRTGPGAAVAHDALVDPGRWFVQVSPDAAVLTVLGVLCWFALLWIAVGLLLVSVATTPGAAGRLADALATQVVPLALGLSVGTAAVAGTVAGPAMAGAALAGTAGAGTSGADTAVTGPAVTKLARVTSARAAATVPTRHAATDHRPQPAGSAPPGCGLAARGSSRRHGAGRQPSRGHTFFGESTGQRRVCGLPRSSAVIPSAGVLGRPDQTGSRAWRATLVRVGGTGDPDPTGTSNRHDGSGRRLRAGQAAWGRDGRGRFGSRSTRGLPLADRRAAAWTASRLCRDRARVAAVVRDESTRHRRQPERHPARRGAH